MKGIWHNEEEGGVVGKVEEVLKIERTEAKAWRAQGPCCLGGGRK